MAVGSGIAALLQGLTGAGEGYFKGKQMRLNEDVAVQKARQDAEEATNAAFLTRLKKLQSGVEDFDQAGKPIIAAGFAKDGESYWDAIARRERESKTASGPILTASQMADVRAALAGDPEAMKRVGNIQVPTGYSNVFTPRSSDDSIAVGVLNSVLSGTAPPETMIPKSWAGPVIKARTPKPPEKPKVLPSGYIVDPETGTAKMIPGGPAAVKQEEKKKEEEERKKTAQQISERTGDVVFTDASRAIKILDKPAVSGKLAPSISKIMSNIPGTEDYELERAIETIKANIGFDKLQQMRAISPTGGALGQVSDFENKLLQATAGNLDIGQPREVLKDNIKRVVNQYLDVVHGPGKGPQRYSLGSEQKRTTPSNAAIESGKKLNIPAQTVSAIQSLPIPAKQKSGVLTPSEEKELAELEKRFGGK